MTRIDTTALQRTITNLRERLLAAERPQGGWVGHLSSSALSTATAVFALATVDAGRYRPLIDRGLDWLCENQDADGGWGDTVESPSNLSTTLLSYSAMAAPRHSAACRESIERTERWLRDKVGTLEPTALARAVEQQYGKDRTFSVPILTMAALSGRLGTGSEAWNQVKSLPFELAVLPHRLFKWLRLPVVSYALPALIAIGQTRYKHLRPANPLARATRHLSRNRSLTVLTGLQPDNGGFLEATPLTSFVVMSLASCECRDHEVVRKGTAFLTASIRDDGSWPIDTNLATWVTTLSIAALSAGVDDGLPTARRETLIEWLLATQHRRVHPYTQAAPGGWAWTDLPGAVPDADDTAGALLALHHLGAGARVTDAVATGIDWLLALQNRDGGIPTFCRGWTKLPFDQSAPDITAHVLAAMGVWLDALPAALRERTTKAICRALRFLCDIQRENGSWVPLWFGNQHAPAHENPVYGTSRALTHLSRVPQTMTSPVESACTRAVTWLLSAQNADGGWGGDASVVSSIEETALAVDALAETLRRKQTDGENLRTEDVDSALIRGAEWLVTNTEEGRSLPATSIGLYFARLWYAEKFYPVTFALAALRKVRQGHDFH